MAMVSAILKALGQSGKSVSKKDVKKKLAKEEARRKKKAEAKQKAKGKKFRKGLKSNAKKLDRERKKIIKKKPGVKLEDLF